MNTFLYGSAQRSRQPLRGFTLIELIIVMGIGGFVTMLTLGLLVKAREKSRQELCSNNLRTIIRGVRAYEESNGRFPPGRLKPDWAQNGVPKTGYTNYLVSQTANEKTGFYSVHVWILPFVNAQKVYDRIDFIRAQAKQLTAQGRPYNINYSAYTQPMPLYLCPADPNTTDKGLAENNYRYNFGGATTSAGWRLTSNPSYEQRIIDLYHPGGNGAFTIGEQGLASSAFTDGLSQTVFFSERTKGDASNPLAVLANNTAIHPINGQVHPTLTPIDQALQLCGETEVVLNFFILTSAGRWPPNNDYANGWPFAGYDSTEYNHVAPPNWQKMDCSMTASFIPDTPGEGAIVAARSEHAGGVNVAYGDGRVKFIKNDIALTPWRAFGTRNGEEVLQQQTSQTQQGQQQGTQSQ